MTGYGGGQAASRDGSLVAVEISSVNRKQLDISASLPRELEPLEPKVRAETARRIARGRVAIRARLEASDEAIARQARVNRALAAAYAREFARLGKELKIEGSVALEQVLAAPGVLRAQPEAADRGRGDRTPNDEHLSPGEHSSFHRTQAQVGLAQREVRGRRGSREAPQPRISSSLCAAERLIPGASVVERGRGTSENDKFTPERR